MLIREDPKLSGYISISWHNMEKALEKIQWNWNNWPALKTLELKSHSLAFVEDSRKAIQSVIEKLTLKDCPPSLEAVLFKVDLTPLLQTKCQYPLRYQPFTNQIFGFGQELDSIQKWIDYEHFLLIPLTIASNPLSISLPLSPSFSFFFYLSLSPYLSLFLCIYLSLSLYISLSGRLFI